MKKKLFSLLSALVISFFTISNVQAVEVAKAGDVVTEEGVYSSTRFVAGNKVTNKANIDGISFVAGNEVTLEGSSEYGFYAGNILNISENIQKDLFVAGNSITINSNAIIGRDAYIAGNTVVIKSNITRDLKAAGTVVDLSGITIGGDVYIDSDEIILDANTVISGKLSYLKGASISELNNAKVGSVEVRENDDLVFEYNFKTKAIDFVVSIVSAFVVLVVLFYLIPSSREKLNNLELSFGSIAKTSGIGLLALIVVPILSIIILSTGFLFPIAFISLAVYGISIYLAFLVSYYVVGNKILSKLFNNDNKYLAILCGVVVVKLIGLIPYIGGFVSIVSLVYGLGLIYKFIKSNASKEN